MCSVQEVPLSLASAGLLKWDFFVASSDHATAVEGHAHQSMVCLCGLSYLLLASCGLLVETCTGTCVRTLCMCVSKVRKEKNLNMFHICADHTHAVKHHITFGISSTAVSVQRK